MRKILILLLGLVLIQSAFALNCLHNDPIDLQILDNVEFACTLNSTVNTACVAMVLDTGNDLMASFPNPYDTAIDKYHPVNSIVKISYDISPFSSLLMDNTTYTYKVICGNEEWEADILTRTKNYEGESIRFMVYVKNNLMLLIGMFIILCFLVFFIWWLIKMRKG